MSRNTSLDNIDSADNMPKNGSSPRSPGVRGVFNSWENDIGDGRGSRKDVSIVGDDQQPQKASEVSFLAVFFNTLDKFLTNHNVEVEAGQPTTFPKVC